MMMGGGGGRDERDVPILLNSSCSFEGGRRSGVDLDDDVDVDAAAATASAPVWSGIWKRV